MDISFDVANYRVISLFGIDVWITETMVNTWIIMGILIALAIFVRVKSRSFKEIPTGFQNFIETVVDFFDNFVRGSAGEKFLFLGNWFFMVIMFILVSNLSGLISGGIIRPPTADWTVTFSFAISTFFIIQAMGLKFRKFKYIKSFFEPAPPFFILNLIGEIARPISLSFRLFGNILAGTILMSLFYVLLPAPVTFLVPSVFHFYFDVFAGVLQAYVFCILSLSFIGVSAGVED